MSGPFDNVSFAPNPVDSNGRVIRPVGMGPLQPEAKPQPSARDEFKAYGALVSRLADGEPHHGFSSVQDLPELTHADLAVILRNSPELFYEAIADNDITGAVVANHLGNAQGSEAAREHLVGITITRRINDYVLPILLRDVQDECSRRAEDAQEHNAQCRWESGDRRTESEIAAFDAGMARVFR